MALVAEYFFKDNPFFRDIFQFFDNIKMAVYPEAFTGGENGEKILHLVPVIEAVFPGINRSPF